MASTHKIFTHLGECPICEKRVTFTSHEAWFRDHLLCSSCSSIPRERALMRIIADYYPNWSELKSMKLHLLVVVQV